MMNWKDFKTGMYSKYTKYLKYYLVVKWTIIVVILIGSGKMYGQNATEIIRKMDEQMQGKSSISEMTMKIVRPTWSREIGIKGWSLGTEYSLILITAPSRDKGSAFLKRDIEMWTWQPSIDRVVKLPPSMMMQSWMGSDFTNDDLVKQSSIVTDFTHQIVADTTLQGYDCYKIELIPKEEAAVVWGRIESYVAKEEYLQLLVKFYDEDDFLVNSMVMSDIREMGGRKIPAVMEMIPADNPEQKTIIEYKSIAFDVPIEEGFFSMQNMKRAR